MTESVIVTTEQSTLLTEKESVTVIVSETQGPPGPKGESAQIGDLDEIVLVSDPLAYYILSKN